jgi:hypothetical protein
MVIGVAQPGVYTGLTAWRSDRSGSLVGSASSAYGVGSITSGALDTTWSTGDLLGIAFDTANGTAQFFKNGVSVFSITWTPTSGAYYTPFVQLQPAADFVTVNFGQRAWAYNAPAGYVALTTKNMIRPIGPALSPNQYFDAVTYTGTGSALSVTGLNFQPDLVWIKNRDAVQSHTLFDSIRGVRANLYSNLTNAETVEASGKSLVSFDPSGFSLGTENAGSGSVNTSTNRFVAWCWKANGASVSNTAGTITSQVSANTTSGFSIVSYTGAQASAFTIGHGLNSAPNFIIAKARNASTNWGVYYTANGVNTNFMVLNTSAAQGTNSGSLTNGSYLISNSTTLQIDASAFANGGSQMIAYCWTAVPGFSSFGGYVGNGLADGPFVYTGFKPRFIITKSTGTANSWEIVDTGRFQYNPMGTTAQNQLRAESNVAESSGPSDPIDVLSNGFKIRSTGAGTNNSGTTYIYMAFAANPFGNANGTAF